MGTDRLCTVFARSFLGFALGFPGFARGFAKSRKHRPTKLRAPECFHSQGTPAENVHQTRNLKSAPVAGLSTRRFAFLGSQDPILHARAGLSYLSPYDGPRGGAAVPLEEGWSKRKTQGVI